MIILLLLSSVILFFYFLSTYNGLVRKRNSVKRSFSTIDVMLKKRHDLIPNLVASVKQYLTHEKQLLTDITALRARAMQSSGSERMTSEAQLSGLLGNLSVVMENYPTLKADRNILQLQASLNDMEEQISASRSAYNGAVVNLNNTIETFPSNIIARMFNFRQAEVVQATVSERQNVNVDNLFNA